jgi:hypothetical protein
MKEPELNQAFFVCNPSVKGSIQNHITLSIKYLTKRATG